jgi:hypothetical protein
MEESHAPTMTRNGRTLTTRVIFLLIQMNIHSLMMPENQMYLLNQDLRQLKQQQGIAEFYLRGNQRSRWLTPRAFI